jgi:BirA family biotin operon repressor/biotin-[acetyl-CoA-carboxylase] ligase
VSLSRAKAVLEGSRFADLRWVAETGSTNSDLAASAGSDPVECALVADHQTAGRGRLDRTWEGPAGDSLLMSVRVHAPDDAGVHLIPIALGLAASASVGSLGGVDVGLKWPNDLVAVGGPSADRKLGGMLSEIHPRPGRGPSVVVGLGVNLRRPDGFDGALSDTATAVDLLGGSIDRDDLVVDLLSGLERLLDSLDDDRGVTSLLADYSSSCVTLGRTVRAELADGDRVGVARAIGVDGALEIELDDGSRFSVRTGDVVHLRTV